MKAVARKVEGSAVPRESTDRDACGMNILVDAWYNAACLNSMKLCMHFRCWKLAK